MNVKLKVKKKDRVIVLAGKDKGKIGEITAVFPKERRVVVSGVNMIKRHTKPTQASPQGGIISKEAAIHVSNVAHIDPKDNKATRAGFKIVKDKKTRIAKRSGQAID